MEMEEPQASASLQLEPGDILALISDGIYEYARPDGEEFGEDRVADVFRTNHDRSMSELGSTLVKAVMDFGGDAPQADDITLVLVRRLPQ
jgi:serine phosphatase RsbU (regulator of sigma subunit)